MPPILPTPISPISLLIFCGVDCKRRFTPKDVGGVPITEAEKRSYWKRHYGDQYAARLTTRSSSTGVLTSGTGLLDSSSKGINTLIDDPAFIELEIKRKLEEESERKASSERASSLQPPPPLSSLQSTVASLSAESVK